MADGRNFSRIQIGSQQTHYLNWLYRVKVDQDWLFSEVLEGHFKIIFQILTNAQDSGAKSAPECLNASTR